VAVLFARLPQIACQPLRHTHTQGTLVLSTAACDNLILTLSDL
jgi:hypothetical protein